MAKQQIPEAQLIDVINNELVSRWPHKARTCRVERLRKVSFPERNWEIDTMSNGGPDLDHVGACDELRNAVLEELSSKYDVQWP
ncbi:hypothetical protein LOY38_16760 [Pseudomonas sp. B21-015]|uniref:hypothetical protein n=1 Tax=Pseudomonas sp. B21-015 TaxID=2895473 RepID=UPI00215ED164|nr:hypothetical protein [Pseudomonas sp. B21-015]UVM48075.1 hypothetical protein LOY38_16760 [Pseudomonas sp. B21-015]